MKKVERVGVLTNRERDTDFSKTLQLVEILEKSGITALLPENCKSRMPNDLTDCSFFGKVDFIITLGGDGTILSVAESAALCGVPVMGINIGNLGYLTDCSFEGADESIKKLIAGNYVLEKRIMLKATLVSGKASINNRLCLNDVCIARGETPKLIHFDLLINNNFVDSYSADGLIISTPTGSTAYNLSAGGPILIPNSDMIAITPVCPHMLTTRPIVVSSSDKITVKHLSSEREAIITLDGHTHAVLCRGDVINVERAESSIEIIKTNSLDFYDVLRKKLICAAPCQ